MKWLIYCHILTTGDLLGYYCYTINRLRNG
ncbi:gp84 [Brochothrix phage A9]|uniref:Gp84 n=1 Tax=Brochothrix phage A9 TaxID=857312 RepID=D9J0N1_9CAUD|nr:gp84 [Brochothrix phage A9]ADJ53123.1 gp84 [Brochothrix phage A9]